MIIQIGVLSVEIEYLQERLIREVIDCHARGPLRVLIDVLTVEN